MIGSFRPYGDVFAQLDRLQQDLQQAFMPGRSIRAMSSRSFPALNVGSTASALEILALAPGIDLSALQITVDKGLLVIAGHRADDAPARKQNSKGQQGEPRQSAGDSQSAAVYAQERFKGPFRRVISLPEDADPANINASYRDGLLRITVARRETSRPRQISIS